MEKNDNELIAEFYGATLDRATSGGRRLWSLVNLPDFCKQIDVPESRIRVFYAEDLEFDRSWDWLMPVVEKIAEINPSICRGELLAIARYKAATILPISTPIDIVYKAVVEFIKWYNSQQHGK